VPGRNHGMPAMPRYNSRSQLCPSRAILAHICGKWSVLILGLLAEDTKRFNELRRCVQGVTQKVLTQNLREPLQLAQVLGQHLLLRAGRDTEGADPEPARAGAARPDLAAHLRRGAAAGGI